MGFPWWSQDIFLSLLFHGKHLSLIIVLSTTSYKMTVERAIHSPPLPQKRRDILRKPCSGSHMLYNPNPEILHARSMIQPFTHFPVFRTWLKPIKTPSKLQSNLSEICLLKILWPHANHFISGYLSVKKWTRDLGGNHTFLWWMNAPRELSVITALSPSKPHPVVKTILL